jgi:hypothetical protein
VADKSDLKVTVEHLRTLIHNLANELMFRYAIEVIRALNERDFMGLAMDYVDFTSWPYAGGRSFADELFYVFNNSFVPDAAELAYEGKVRSACWEKFCSLTDAERELLAETCSPGRPDDDKAIDRLAQRVLRIARDYDKEILGEMT